MKFVMVPDDFPVEVLRTAAQAAGWDLCETLGGNLRLVPAPGMVAAIRRAAAHKRNVIPFPRPNDRGPGAA